MKIDWVRAAFAGAVGGGVLWAFIVKLLVDGIGPVSTVLRAVWVVVAVCVVLMVLAVLLYQFASGGRTRGYAVAMIIAPCTGLGLLLFLIVLGQSRDLIGTR